MKTIRILDVLFADLSYAEARERISMLIVQGTPAHVVLANAHTLNIACTDPEYRRYLQDADLVLRDGIGVKLASIAKRSRFGYNFVGTDFIPKLLRDHGTVRVYLFGAQPGRAERAALRLQQLCPALRVVGVQHGYLNPAARDASVVAAIESAKPDVLLVALGNPEQERWIARHLTHLNATVSIGVGALFDYLAGDVPRAPGWVRALGCEWVFRLIVEPRRLWRRYVLGNPAFLLRVIRDRSPARRPDMVDGGRPVPIAPPNEGTDPSSSVSAEPIFRRPQSSAEDTHT